MFLFKKLFAPIFFPVPLCLGILVAGLFLLWFTRNQRIGRWVVTIGVILFAMMSYEPIPDAFLGPLEYKDPPVVSLGSRQLTTKGAPRTAKWIVVLGGGHTSDPKLPITSQISGRSLINLVEGIRLYRQMPDRKIILSGGGYYGTATDAEIMATIARSLGVSDDDLVLETESRDTKDKPRLIRNIVGDDVFLLVTSASHMPRAKGMFEKQGMKPIAAPTGHLVKRTREKEPRRHFPNAKGWEKSERLIYETLGLVWAKLRGQI